MTRREAASQSRYTEARPFESLVGSPRRTQMLLGEVFNG